MKKSTSILREVYELTQVELANLFGIPVRTIENWELRKCCPDYVYNMIDCILFNAACAVQKDKLKMYGKFYEINDIILDHKTEFRDKIELLLM